MANRPAQDFAMSVARNLGGDSVVVLRTSWITRSRR